MPLKATSLSGEQLIVSSILAETDYQTDVTGWAVLSRSSNFMPTTGVL
jgi:hypothetical protein